MGKINKRSTSPKNGDTNMNNNLVSSKIKKITRNDVEITINYIDSVGTPLAEPVTLQGHYNDNLDMPWKTIPGYVLSSVQNFQQTFIPNPDGIYLIYFKQMAAPVVVYHRNTNGELISDPQYIYGELNKDYQAKPLAEAERFLVDYPKKSKGQFSSQVQEYEFVYNTIPFVKYEIKKDLFVRTNENVDVFEEPGSKNPLQLPLPHDSTWRVYKALKETYSNTIWYNLGGSTWIPSSENISSVILKQYSEEKKAIDSPLSANANNISYIYQIIDSMPINRSAKILYYSDQNVTAWETPYGTMDNHRYFGGQEVFVTRLIQLDNNSVWAELKDGYYIESKYLNL